MATDRLSLILAALADPTRRAILARLGQGEATVMELAEPFDLKLPTVSKHLKVLQRAGLVSQGRKAQWRPCRLEAAPLKDVAEWIERYRDAWEERHDRLEDYLRELQAGDRPEDQERSSDLATREQIRGEAIMSKATLTADPAKQDIVMTRVFDAPRELVFKTYTDPAHIPHWWGPKNLSTTVERMDVKPGGGWRFVQRDGDGNEYAFHGVYHEVVAPERLVFTFEFEGMPGHVMLATVTFEDVQGKTRLTDTSVFQTIEDRDGMLASGMEQGATESMDRLAELLAREVADEEEPDAAT